MPFQEPELVLVDGIPVWCTDVPGPCMGGLIFRTGRIDETLVNGGINHIVEHLALYPFEPRRYDLNGTVTELTTSFYASGTRDDVEAVLSGVCAHLEALPMDRLDAERRVLETEARRGGGSFAGTASARFGARGAGVIDWPELGIRGLTGEAVEAWARERFTAGQAVGWMTRPPSDGLRLPLSAGARLPIPAAEPLTALRTPSHITSDERFIGCSMLAPRSMPLYIAIQLFLSRGFSRLRTDLGLAYTVSQSSDRISGTDSLFLLFSDAAEGEGPRVLGAFCDVLEDLSAGELTDDDVSAAHERAMPWNATDQTRPQREAARKATASLLGHAPTTWAQLAEQGAALTPDAVQEAMRGALDTAILVDPGGRSRSGTVRVSALPARASTQVRNPVRALGRQSARSDLAQRPRRDPSGRPIDLVGRLRRRRGAAAGAGRQRLARAARRRRTLDRAQPTHARPRAGLDVAGSIARPRRRSAR